MFVKNVGNLSAESIFSHFTKYGEVEKVTIAKDPKTGISRGFAFVKFFSLAEAKYAVNDGNETEVSYLFII